MKMTRCPEKHLYDADTYKTCPYCSGELKEGTVQGKAPRKGKVVKVRAVKARRSSDVEEKKPVEAQAAPKAEEKKPVEAKTAPKAEEKKPVEAKTAPKAEEKKPVEAKTAPKAEEKKPVETKTAPKAEEKKPADKKDKKPVRTDDGAEIAMEILDSIPKSEKAEFKADRRDDIFSGRKKTDTTSREQTVC